jgi:hypothetical protein
MSTTAAADSSIILRRPPTPKNQHYTFSSPPPPILTLPIVCTDALGRWRRCRGTRGVGWQPGREREEQVLRRVHAHCTPTPNFSLHQPPTVPPLPRLNRPHAPPPGGAPLPSSHHPKKPRASRSARSLTIPAGVTATMGTRGGPQCLPPRRSSMMAFPT